MPLLALVPLVLQTSSKQHVWLACGRQRCRLLLQ
jgi:hypothetical protein